jgi:isopentenyldiphosphate isomerase
VDDSGRILVAHRRHKIFDRVWTLSGDTHPYRTQGGLAVEGIVEAAKRCAMDDLGVRVKHWPGRLTLSYSARDPRDPRYCENEFLHIMTTNYGGPLRMNKKNAYDLRWVEFAEISKESAADVRMGPIDRKYAPWVHELISLPAKKIEEALHFI